MAKRKGFTPPHNFIKSALRNNFTNALTAAQYHYDAVAEAATGGDVDYTLMKNSFKPKLDTLVTIDAAKRGQLGLRIGSTKSLKDLFKSVPELLDDWQSRIKNVYKENTPEYKAFFYAGNTPFTVGTIDNKISAFNALHELLVADGHAIINTTIAAEVDAFYQDLITARVAQGGKKGTVKTQSGLEIKAINDMAVAHFVNYGRLVIKHPENPEVIQGFIDVITLQSHHHSSQYDLTVNAGATKKALNHKWAPVSTIVVDNTGDADVQLYVVKSAKAKIHPTGVTVPKGSVHMIIHVDTLGDTTHRILMVRNIDAATPASLTIYVGDTKTGSTMDPHD